MQSVQGVIKYKYLLLLIFTLNKSFGQNKANLPKLESGEPIAKVMKCVGSGKIFDGLAIYQFKLDIQGKVDSVKIIYSNQLESFNEAQIKYLKSLLFIPNKENSNYWIEQKMYIYHYTRTNENSTFCDNKVLYDIYMQDFISFGNNDNLFYNDIIHLKPFISTIKY